ncbi:MAG: VWA domain-containing protein [Bacteroidota bacterium]
MDLHLRLEALNADANLFIQQGGGELQFRLHDMVHHYHFFGGLQGVCTRTQHGTKSLVDLKELYQLTKSGGQALSPKANQEFSQTRERLMSHLNLILNLSEKLVLYTQQKKYVQDSRLTELYAHLHQIAALYGSVKEACFELKLLVKEYSRPLPPPLKELNDIILHARNLCLDIAAGKEEYARRNLIRLELAIRSAEEGRVLHQDEMRKLDLYYDKENTGYLHMMDYARAIKRRAEAYLNADWYSPAYKAYGKHYYYYNERMLGLFNHHKYGITAYYNRFLGFASKTFNREMEEVPLFKVLSPNLAPKIAEAISPVMAKLSKAEKERALQGAAANNLVFLLDVSASMNRPEKLPLMKAALEDFIELLRPEDQVAIVVFAGEANVLLTTTPAIFKEEIYIAIDRLATGGKTKTLKGFREAYRLAERNYIPGGNNRIIFASDGSFDTGANLRRMIEKKANQDIQLTVFLFNNRESAKVAEQLSILANLGGGNYAHIRPQNAQKILIREANAVRKR